PHPGLWYRFSPRAAAMGRPGRSSDRREDRAAVLAVWLIPDTPDQPWKRGVADRRNSGRLQARAGAGSVAAGRDRSGIQQTMKPYGGKGGVATPVRTRHEHFAASEQRALFSPRSSALRFRSLR